MQRSSIAMTDRDELLLAPYGLRHDGTAYGPNPTQRRILEWVDRCRQTPFEKQDHIPVLYLRGGNGSGKTRGVLAPVDEILTQIPGIRVLWGRWDFKDLKLSVMDTFFEVMPPELIGDRSEQYHYYDILQPDDRFGRIYFSGLKDISGLGSQEFAVIIMTEAHEGTLQMYRTLKRRCRQKGYPCFIILESEAPQENHWLESLTRKGDPDYDPDVECWELSTYENWENLPTAYRGSLESMPEAAKRRYLFGKPGFDVAGKPYYSGFDLRVHTGQFEWNPHKELLCGWDFGYHFPAFLVTQMGDVDDWIWLRELLGRDVTIDRFCDQVEALLNEHYPGATLVHFGDPASRQASDKSEMTSWQICAQRGFRIGVRQSMYRERKEIIERKLSTLHGGVPAIRLDDRYCKTCIDGFSGGYHYPTRREDQQFQDRFELPFRDGFYEHLMNAGEYIAVNRWRAVRQDAFKERQPNYGFRRQDKGAVPRARVDRQPRIYR